MLQFLILKMNSDGEERNESEFYCPTEHFTCPVPRRNEVSSPRSAMESPTSQEQFRANNFTPTVEIRNHEVDLSIT